jgi:uncharacterized membrane-anchored protein
MTTTTASSNAPSFGRQMLNKVPEITIYFWIIKVLCTTVGETGADNLATHFNLSLTDLTYIVGGTLLTVLAIQFRLKRYVPFIYWLGIVLISVVGTLITDNMTDNFGIALTTSTAIFTVILAATFAVWYRSERTLSIHTIVTTRREAFYWMAVLFTFALGTAAGDLVAEKLALGYLNTLLLFAGSIAVIALAHWKFRMGAILSFWLAYILTRPLGASIGDYMSQAKADGGLGLGTTTTSLIYLGLILALVVFLSLTKADQTPPDVLEAEEEKERREGHGVPEGFPA